MNRKIRVLLLATVMLALPSASRSQSPEATESAPLETIKENVKKRIQEVVEKQSDSLSETAYIGTLISRTTTSLTLETKNGSQLASGSAQIAVKSADSKDDTSFEDLEIGDYMSIIGVLDAQDVLLASNILLAPKPKQPSTQHLYGVMSDYNEKEDTLTVSLLPSQEQKVFELTAKSVIEQATTQEARELEAAQLTTGLPLIVVYQAGATPEDAGTLIHATVKVAEFLEAEVSPTPSPKVSPTRARTPSPSPKVTP